MLGIGLALTLSAPLTVTDGGGGVETFNLVLAGDQLTLGADNLTLGT